MGNFLSDMSALETGVGWTDAMRLPYEDAACAALAVDDSDAAGFAYRFVRSLPVSWQIFSRPHRFRGASYVDVDGQTRIAVRVAVLFDDDSHEVSAAKLCAILAGEACARRWEHVMNCWCVNGALWYDGEES